MGVNRKLSLDKDVLSRLESDELAQLAGGEGFGTLVTCNCPAPTRSTCVHACDTQYCTYYRCATIPLNDCIDPA